METEHYINTDNPNLLNFVVFAAQQLASVWKADTYIAAQDAIANGYAIPYMPNELSFRLWFNRLSNYVNRQSRVNRGYVYLVEAISKTTGETLAYKIGCSTNPDRRTMGIFPTKQPFIDVRLLHTIKTDDMDQLETRLHNEYADKRTDGEWFNLSESDIEKIKSLRGVIYYLDVEVDQEYFRKIESVDKTA